MAADPGYSSSVNPSAPQARGASSTPLPRKLGISAECRVAVLGAPDGLTAVLTGGVPAAVALRGSFDVVVQFALERAVLERRLTALTVAIAPAGALWVAWPKRASKVPTDITEDVVRDVALPVGLVDVKVCAIDAIWSGLKLVIRTELRDRDPATLRWP